MCLRRGSQVNARDSRDMTPLHLAFYDVDYSVPATKALPPIIQELVTAGADVNAVEKERGRTVVHLFRDQLQALPYDFRTDEDEHDPIPALTLRSFTTLVECTKSRSGSSTSLDITATDIGNRSVIHRSWHSDNCAALKYLDSEFDLTSLLNMTDHLGNTPLHIPHSDVKALEILVRRSKDICCRNKAGVSPLLDVLKRLAHRTQAIGYGQDFREQCKMIQQLLLAGAWKDIEDPPPAAGVRTLFHSEYIYHREEVFQLFVTKWPGYNHQQCINIRDDNGDTPLQSLLKRLAPPRPKEPRSPAYTIHFWVGALRLLIYGGADASIQDNAGNTPLMTMFTTLITILDGHLLGIFLPHFPVLILFAKLAWKLLQVLENCSSQKALSLRNKAGLCAPQLAQEQLQIWERSGIFSGLQCMWPEKKPVDWVMPKENLLSDTLVVGVFSAMEKPWLEYPGDNLGCFLDDTMFSLSDQVGDVLHGALRPVAEVISDWNHHVDQMEAELAAKASVKDASV